MISAKSTFDVEMVRAFFEKHGLDPKPSKEPTAIKLADGSRLTVETYGWGRVFFAEFRSRGLGVTWVEYKTAPALPPWAAELRRRVDVPECFGWWRPEPECDGNRRKVPPCSYRGTCIVLQRRALKKKRVELATLPPADVYGPRLATARAGVTLAELAKEAEPDPQPIPVQRPRAPASEWRKLLEKTHEVMRSIGKKVAEIGGWRWSLRPRTPSARPRRLSRYSRTPFVLVKSYFPRDTPDCARTRMTLRVKTTYRHYQGRIVTSPSFLYVDSLLCHARPTLSRVRLHVETDHPDLLVARFPSATPGARSIAILVDYEPSEARILEIAKFIVWAVGERVIRDRYPPLPELIPTLKKPSYNKKVGKVEK